MCPWALWRMIDHFSIVRDYRKNSVKKRNYYLQQRSILFIYSASHIHTHTHTHTNWLCFLFRRSKKKKMRLRVPSRSVPRNVPHPPMGRCRKAASGWWTHDLEFGILRVLGSSQEGCDRRGDPYRPGPIYGIICEHSYIRIQRTAWR